MVPSANFLNKTLANYAAQHQLSASQVAVVSDNPLGHANRLSEVSTTQPPASRWATTTHVTDNVLRAPSRPQRRESLSSISPNH